MNRDVFLCHASADKDKLARPLYHALQNEGLSVWFDEAEILWGHSIVDSIQNGLTISRFVLVLLTPKFVATEGNWRREELHAALGSQIASGATTILPLVCDLSDADLRAYLPFVAARRYERITSDTNPLTVAAMVHDRVRRRSQPLLVTREEADREVGTVEARVAAAKEVWISANDGKFVAESLSGFIKKALERNVRVRLMCVDPTSSAAEMLPLIDPRFETADEFRNSVRSVEAVVKQWIGPLPFEFRYLPILPAVGYFITDPSSRDGIVKVEIYVAKPWAINSRPHLIIPPTMPEWRRFFINQYENYWNLAIPVT